MIVGKPIISDFYSINHFISNIINNEFIDKKNVLNKKNYQHNFIGNSSNEYGISPIEHTICNFIGDLIHITDNIIPSVIYILLVAFPVIFLNSQELFN